jgi:ribosomal protein S18 acetylase RimI-like enzyme
MLRFQYLNENHKEIIDDFQCLDEPSVSEFLKEQALTLHQSNCAITRLYFDEYQNLIGFFTLYNDHIEVSKAKKQKHNWELPRDIRFFPAIKLHYLGIDERYRGRGYGQELMYEVFDVCQEIAALSGCVFITVEALNSAVGFYEKNGFDLYSRNVYFQNMILKIDEL